MKNRASINRESIVESLELPQDLLLGRTILTMNGNRELLVENHRGILDYNETEITVLSKEFKLLVSGSGISIDYYTKDTIKIRGKFSQIQFAYDS